MLLTVSLPLAFLRTFMMTWSLYDDNNDIQFLFDLFTPVHVYIIVDYSNIWYMSINSQI